MRELIFKNLYSAEAKKRDISVEEVIEKDGIIAITKKRSLYFIRSRYHIECQDDLKRWAEDKKKNLRLNKKWFHIMRMHSDRKGEENLLCKARGAFYAIIEKDIYNIVFVHMVTMRTSKAH